MSNLVVYSCQCLNIRTHLATKHTLENLEDYKKENVVNEPLYGWEFELGMGGLKTEFSFLTSSRRIVSGWNTFSCLNCNTNDIYSIPDSNQHKIIIHKSAICGNELDKLKERPDYSYTFNINLSKDNIKETIPMPDSTEDIPENLLFTFKQIKSSLDQSIEQLHLESKVRIGQFKKEEEKQLQSQISQAKLENNLLWTQAVSASRLVDNNQEKIQEPSHHLNHVRFAVDENQQQPMPTPSKRLNFALDESAFTHLKNVNMDSYLNSKGQNTDDEASYDEEDMFHLDEEFSEEEKDSNVDENKQNNDLLLSSSLKKSISEIDQRFSWAKKKKNTSKYIAKDFDIKADLTKDTLPDNNESVSLFATSVPISIQYRFAEEDANDNKGSSSPNKRDILVSSFANFDSSFSDRMLSSQFPAPRRRKSLASSSLIRPQLDSLTGKSLDTRGLMRKKTNEIDLHQSDEEFDSTVPPHVWAATIEDE